MKDFKKLQEMDRRMRELAGLYAAERERADSLAEELRSFVKIREHYEHAKEKHPYFCMKDELTNKLAKHLQSALRWIAREYEDRFVDDMGEELPREDGGNFSFTSFDVDFGDYTFDFREAEEVLNQAGLTVEEELGSMGEQVNETVADAIDALGTDGDTAADVEEAKASGRHFVVRTLGNAAKMREALKAAERTLSEFMGSCDCLADVRAALSAPVRNCDVGTAEEQTERFYDYCKRQGKGCGIGKSKGACPIFDVYRVDCSIVWAQMPYEEVKE